MTPASLPVDPFDLVIFGGTGDLAMRKLLPALFHRFLAGQIRLGSRLVGAAREPLDDDGYRAAVRVALGNASDHTPEQRDAFLGLIGYRALDARKDDGWDGLAGLLAERPDNVRVFYLSTSPELFVDICERLARHGLNQGAARVVLEKPIGRDLASANRINDDVGCVFAESQTYRIDHYLGKETVQNLLALRFANVMFEPLWNAAHIDHIQITVAETIGVEGRGDYYDGAGALRDMVQNHMLQLLALVAMEPPSDFNATAVRDEKVKVLRALRPIGAAEAEADIVAGQYAGYAEEMGHDSATETFVALKAQIDNWRWKGVPFYLRTGKRMPERETEIFIQFKDVPYSIFASRGATALPNKLIIGLQPEESIELRLMAKTPGLDREGVRLREIPLDIGLANAFSEYRRRIAYERLLLDLIEGDPTLFVRRDEVEAQWQWIDGIRAAWAETGMTPQSYPAGSWGPPAATALAERDGISWDD